MNATRPYIVGLTGGIGSGKSAATAHFAALGASVVDTDLIAHALTAPGGAAIEAIRHAFGEAMLAADGSLDRAAMRALAFQRPQARRQLEAILHPLIRDESARQCRAAPGPYVILAVPLLIESGDYRARCDRICVVDCPEDLQVTRVHQRNALPEEQIQLQDLLRSWRELNSATNAHVDIVSLGNPHFSLSEFAHLARLCSGRSKHATTVLAITCGRAVLEQARAAGHIAEIERFGATLVTDTCWCILGEPVIPPGATTLMTNSGKFAHYAPGLVGRTVHFANLAECVEAACSGTASGRLPTWLQPALPMETPAHV